MQIEISRETVVKTTFKLDLSVVNIKNLCHEIVSSGCDELPVNDIQTAQELVEFLSRTDSLYLIFNALQNCSEAGVSLLDDEFGNENYYFYLST
jgi:hypothetical protein